MKPMIQRFLSLTLAVVLAAAPLTAFASEALGDDLTASSVTVNDGTQLNAGTFWSNTYSDLRQENYVVYEPNRSVRPIVTCGDYTTQLTTVSAAARELEEDGWRVVAGVNGDYYDTANGIPLGSVMTDGVLRNLSGENYAVGFYEDGTVVMGKPELTIYAEPSNSAGFRVSALNYIRQSSYGIFLYNDTFNARGTIGTSERGVDVICSVVRGELSIGGTLELEVEEIVDGGVDTAVGKDEYVLSANLSAGASYTDALRALRCGDRIKLSVTANDHQWDDVTNMVGALYQLVENGTVCSGLPTGAAPRTAVGLRRDGSLVIYTIDGRQSGYSIGATLAQTAERMIELGCVTALSLDGGGSTAMVATDPADTTASLVSKPSGGSERAVTNHIFLVATSRSTGSVGHIYLTSESTRVLPNAEVKLTAVALDTNYIPMPSKTVTLRADNGEIDGDILTAPASGTATVYASAGGSSAQLQIEVVAKADSISVRQNDKPVTAISLMCGESTELSASAMYRHLSVLGNNRGFSWSVQGDVGTIKDGVFTAANRPASGSVSVSLGNVSVTIPVTISARALRTAEDYESAFSTSTGTRAMLSQCTDMTRVHNGYASARLDYATGQGDAFIALGYAVPTNYDQLNFWVYGDKSGAQLWLVTDLGYVDLGALDFSGWRLISAPLGGASRVEGLALSMTEEHIGAIYLDQLVFSYGELTDTAAPAISLKYDAGTNTVSGTVDDKIDGAAVTTLRVSYDGKSLSSYTYDKTSGALSVSLPAADGAQHRLSVTAGDASGNLARASVDTKATDTTPAFTDMQGHWANAAVSYLSRNGITNGSGSGKFAPETNITRQEFAVLLERYLAPSEDYSGVTLPFADADKISSWALSGAKAMYALGVIQGSRDANGRLCFNPTANVSRQEVVTMIGRVLEKGYAAPALTFKDNASIQSWSAEYVSTLSAMGVLTGFEDGTFRPNAPMTRAQIAAVLYKML